VSVVPSERELVDRARVGDVHAFSLLVRRHDHKMRMLAYRLVGEASLMDDVLQDSYLRAFEALPRFRGDSAVGTWLYRIVYNRSIDELRRLRRQQPVPSPDPVSARFEDDVVARVDLANALAALPTKQRAAVVMVDAMGMEYSDAAKAMGVPVGTVRSRVSRGRAALGRIMQRGAQS
jgi:RNA polymerase sigma-70 factor (ECF subfamily)